MLTAVCALAVLSCTDRDEPLGPECFPEDPWQDAINEAYEYAHTPGFIPDELGKMQLQIGWCEYPPNNTEYFQYTSAFPDKDYTGEDPVRYCEEVPESGECEQCPEDMDAVLRAEYEAQPRTEPACEGGGRREIVDYERGCVGKYLTDDGEMCCWSAVVYAPCAS